MFIYYSLFAWSSSELFQVLRAICMDSHKIYSPKCVDIFCRSVRVMQNVSDYIFVILHGYTNLWPVI